MLKLQQAILRRQNARFQRVLSEIPQKEKIESYGGAVEAEMERLIFDIDYNPDQLQKAYQEYLSYLNTLDLKPKDKKVLLRRYTRYVYDTWRYRIAEADEHESSRSSS